MNNQELRAKLKKKLPCSNSFEDSTLRQRLWKVFDTNSNNQVNLEECEEAIKLLNLPLAKAHTSKATGHYIRPVIKMAYDAGR